MNNGQETATSQPVSNIVAAIREEATQNEVFGAICYNFAQRQRTRGDVTLRGLQARMELQGADFKREEYEHALRFLANLGLGTLKHDKKGRITALSNLKVTLQSIGQASALKVTELGKFQPNRRYQKLPVANQTSSRTLTYKPEFRKRFTVDLVVKLDGKPIPIPESLALNAYDLAEFLNEFTASSKKFKPVGVE